MKKILVVEDCQIHIDAAKEQFTGRNEYHLFIATTVRDAERIMVNEKIDVVMTDVMLPISTEGLSREALEKFASQLAPTGLVVALIAVNKGVEEIYLVSDMNHHQHPVAWALDLVGGKRIKQSKRPVACNGKKDWYGCLTRKGRDVELADSDMFYADGDAI